MEEIGKCKFCNGEAQLEAFEGGFFLVSCTKCNTIAKVSRTPEAAIKEWDLVQGLGSYFLVWPVNASKDDAKKVFASSNENAAVRYFAPYSMNVTTSVMYDSFDQGNRPELHVQEVGEDRPVTVYFLPARSFAFVKSEGTTK